jgi:hypothetical protein
MCVGPKLPMVMINRLVELPFHLITFRLDALTPAEITNPEATTHDRKLSVINQPSEIIDFSSHQIALSMRAQIPSQRRLVGT